MPLTGLICPKCSKVCGLDEAAAHMDDCGAMMAEAVQAIVNGVGNERRSKQAGLSPSMVPTKTCRREVLINRNLDYAMNPMKIWAAEQGTTFHRALLKRGKGGEWMLEQVFPGALDDGKEGVRDHGGWLELELWPNVWVSTEVDKMSIDGSVIVDLKTQRPATKDYGPQNASGEWAFQLNLERMIVEKLGYGPVQELWVWRLYGYAYDEAVAWRKFRVPILGDDVIEKVYREWAVELAAWQKEIDGGRPVEEVVAGVPMEGKLKPSMVGKNMWKCNGYCGVKDICFGLAGEVIT